MIFTFTQNYKDVNMSENILEVKDLVVNYGAIRALKGISFNVESGEIISLIGSN